MRMLLLLLLILAAGEARAAEYPEPSLALLAQTMLRFNAIETQDDKMLDDYARVAHCDIFARHYADDFTWKRVRAALRKEIKQKLPAFPVGYGVVVSRQLDRYDFRQQVFKFTEAAAIRSVNSFILTERFTPGRCALNEVKFFPLRYRVRLEYPVSIEAIPMTEDDAKALLERMAAAKNEERIIYARFNIRVTFAERWNALATTARTGTVLEGRLESVQFFEDAELTRLFYEDQP